MGKMLYTVLKKVRGRGPFKKYVTVGACADFVTNCYKNIGGGGVKLLLFRNTNKLGQCFKIFTF